jgi:hypothetical protein
MIVYISKHAKFLPNTVNIYILQTYDIYCTSSVFLLWPEIHLMLLSSYYNVSSPSEGTIPGVVFVLSVHCSLRAYAKLLQHFTRQFSYYFAWLLITMLRIVYLHSILTLDISSKSKSIALSGGRRENFWGISCEKSRFCAKKSYFFQF